MFPEPDCDRGYSRGVLEDALGAERFAELMDWMYGQTMMLCDGRRYDHDAKEYYETHPAHGPVVYTWDVEWFLRGGRIVD